VYGLPSGAAVPGVQPWAQVPQVVPANRPIKPAWWWYLVGAGLFLVGVASFVLLFHSMMTFHDRGAKAPVPGTAQVRLDEPGQYVIAYEPSVLVAPDDVGTAAPAGTIGIALSSIATGDEVDLRASAAGFTYTFGATSGRVVAEFTVDQPGTYLVRSDLPGTAGAGDDGVLVLGKNPIRHATAETTTGAFGLLSGSTLLIVLIIRRHLARRRSTMHRFG